MGALAVAAGAVFGVAGTIAHAYTAGPLPVGLVLALVGCGALLVALRLLVEARWVTWAAGFAMIALLAVYSGTGPGGSVVVPQSAPGEFPLGLVWSYALPGVVLLVAAWPDPARLRTGPAAGPGTRRTGDAAGSGDVQSGTRRIDP
ncbi:hypothetical protein GCM10010921_27940 [Microbacterium album]|uniref:Histidinol dehydrogenase n=1 Tax=Microbacterium album TaxID=2053191 RepID=A0A917MMV3_9MICO|nr:hypothetical protein GCM10010921_27940 [Microbacterium album]